MTGLEAGGRGRDDLRDGLVALLGHGFARGEYEGGRSVVDVRGVTGGDGPILLEGGAQRG